MAIQDLFDKELIIYRLKSAGGNKTSFQSTATVEGALQNKQLELQSNLGIISSRNWVAYVDGDADVKIGDRLHYGGRNFLVDDLIPRDYGINQHLELLLKEDNA